VSGQHPSFSCVHWVLECLLGFLAQLRNYLWKVRQQQSESLLLAQVNNHVHNINYNYTNGTPTMLPDLDGNKPCYACINELIPAFTMRSTNDYNTMRPYYGTDLFGLMYVNSPPLSVSAVAENYRCRSETKPGKIGSSSLEHTTAVDARSTAFREEADRGFQASQTTNFSTRLLIETMLVPTY